MRTLIAVTTCAARRSQAEAQRRTWASGPDVRFFVGECEPREGEVSLAVDDSYEGLPAKVRAVMRWAMDHGYDSVLKADDDVYLVPSRLPSYAEQYVGNFRMHNGDWPHDYASGFAYFLGPCAVWSVANAELTRDTMEDRWVGNVLGAARGITTLDDKRFNCSYPGIEEARFLWGSPIGRTHIAFGQYPAHKMHDMHYWYTRCFVDNRTA